MPYPGCAIPRFTSTFWALPLCSRLIRGEPHLPVSLSHEPAHPGTVGTRPLFQHRASPPCHSTTCLHREYGTIDDVDIDLHVNISFLDVSPRGALGSAGMGRVGTCAQGGAQFALPGWRFRGCAKTRLSLGRRRWRRRGRCCGQSPSSSACASPSPSTSMAPVSGDGQDVVSLCPRDRHSGGTDSLSSCLPAEPSIEVFQPSNKEGFGLGLQLKK